MIGKEKLYLMLRKNGGTVNYEGYMTYCKVLKKAVKRGLFTISRMPMRGMFGKGRSKTILTITDKGVAEYLRLSKTRKFKNHYTISDHDLSPSDWAIQTAQRIGGKK